MSIDLKSPETNLEANSGRNGHILVGDKENVAKDPEIALKRDAAMDVETPEDDAAPDDEALPAAPQG